MTAVLDARGLGKKYRSRWALRDCTLQVPAAKAGLIGSFVLLLGIVMRPLGGVLLQHIGMRALLGASFLASSSGTWGSTLRGSWTSLVA